MDLGLENLLELLYSSFISKGENSIRIFMGLSKAFDSVDHSLHLKGPREYGIQSLDLQWFESHLSGRQQYVDISHINNKSKITNKI